MDDYKPWMPLAEIKKALMIASPCIALGLGLYIVLGRQEWYRNMGQYFDKNPLVLGTIIVVVIAVVLVYTIFTILTRDRTPNEDES